MCMVLVSYPFMLWLSMVLDLATHLWHVLGMYALSDAHKTYTHSCMVCSWAISPIIRAGSWLKPRSYGCHEYGIPRWFWYAKFQDFIGRVW